MEKNTSDEYILMLFKHAKTLLLYVTYYMINEKKKIRTCN